MSSDQPDAQPSAPDDPLLAPAARIRARGMPLVDAADRQRPGSREHGEATAAYAFATAVELGRDRGDSELVREAAKLHEVGRIYAAEDYHEAGAALARGAGIPEPICEWLLHVRERFDGGGPGGGSGGEIPLESRIIRAACVFASSLGEAEAGGRDAAIEALRAAAGGELDPEVVEALLAVIERA